MKPKGEIFTIRYNERQVAIETYIAKGFEVYCIKFPDQEQVFITRNADAATGKSVWTSLPEGNNEVAVQVGEIIDKRNNLPKQSSLF